MPLGASCDRSIVVSQGVRLPFPPTGRSTGGQPRGYGGRGKVVWDWDAYVGSAPRLRGSLFDSWFGSELLASEPVVGRPSGMTCSERSDALVWLIWVPGRELPPDRLAGQIVASQRVVHAPMAVPGTANRHGRVVYVPIFVVVVILRRSWCDSGAVWLEGHSERRSSWSWGNRM